MYFSTAFDGKRLRGLPPSKTLLCMACVIILVINAVFLMRNLDDLRSANALQAQTSRVSDELQVLNLLITDAESGLRGYFLSGSESNLAPLNAAPRQIDGQLRALGILLSDNPSQAKNLSQLSTLVKRKLDLMNQAVEVYRRGGLVDIVAIAAAAEARGEMDEIRLQIVIMTREQNEIKNARTAAFYEQSRRTVLFGVGINALAILVLLLFHNLVQRSFGLRLEAECALQGTNDSLEALVTERTEQLSVLSRHLIRVSEEEKSRLARELHDEMGANLTAIGMDMSTVSSQLHGTHPELVAMLARARKTLVDTVQLKRRIIENLRPSLLDNMGLSAALQSYCADYARVTALECDALIDADVDAAGPMQSIALFRITQEALNNVAKYAKAHSVIVHLTRESGGWELEITDDGIGIPSDAMAKSKSHGLLGMRERALLMGGALNIGRGVNGVGTCVQAWIATAPGTDTGRVVVPVLEALDTTTPPANIPETASRVGPGDARERSSPVMLNARHP